MQKELHISYEEFNNWSELNEQDRELLSAAQDATELAYVPYSQFKVGAAVLLESGKIYKAGNQENASYPITICAERTLLSTITSVANGEKILAMAVSYYKNSENYAQPISPCGMCRQAIVEFETRQGAPIPIILGSNNSDNKVYKVDGIASLLPFQFTSEDLK
jgi:cytidine deaminase